jgi:putative ABC transport system permease protein
MFLNKSRVFLSLTGIALGIASVIVLVAIGNGASNKMLSQIQSMGTNLITIDAGKVKEVLGRRRQVSKATSLKEKDCEIILEECGSKITAAPTQEQTRLIKYENGTTSGRVIGTTPEYPEIRNFRVARGRFFTDEENKLSSRVVVIGTKVISNLFGNKNPIGEFIRINNIPFEIIGTLESKGSSYDDANEDEIVFIPIKTGMRRLFNVDYIKNIYVHVNNQNNIEAIQNEIQSILRERHKLNLREKEDDFTIQNVYMAIYTEAETTKSFSLLILSVAGLSLLVGSVGILAVMLLSVKERTSEIGLRIAVGAKSKDILIQFLFEAVLLSGFGGILGILAGILCTFLLNCFIDFNSVITFSSVIISVMVSGFLGMFFGVYPARKASRIQPIKALNG